MAEISEFEAKKRQLIKKKRRARIKRRLILFSFFFVCIGIIFTVLKAPLFNVKSIMCVGQTELTEEEIIKIAGAKTDVNIFSTGVKIMKKRLAANPLIDECNVRRLYPNKIKIWVREAKTCAYTENNGLFLLVDENGQIIKVADVKEKDIISGKTKLEKFKAKSTKPGEYIADTQNSSHQKAIECMGLLSELELLDKTAAIDTSDLSNITIDYDNRLMILIGGYEQMEYKLTFIKKVIAESLSEYEKAILDYRGDKLYVAPRTEEVVQEQPKDTEETNKNDKNTSEIEQKSDDKTKQNQ